MSVPSSKKDAYKIRVCVFLQPSSELGERLNELLVPDHYSLNISETLEDLLESCSQQVDCLVVERPSHAAPVFAALEEGAILLPSVLLTDNSEGVQEVESAPDRPNEPLFFYHPAEIKLEFSRLSDNLPHLVCQAVANFIRLSTIARADKRESIQMWFAQPSLQNELKLQQVRLSQKLKERLGYLGVYYKRDPQQFLRRLPEEERMELVLELKQDYRQITLDYFHEDENVNALLDGFVTKAFFADISVTWLLEMHMELMDNFAKLLKLEGRSDEVLLDYRLTLIDAIAHLSEMYRLSIPKDA